MHGFVKIAAAVPSIKVADARYNTNNIIEQMVLADSKNVEIICFPELCITGYTCGDLFQQQLILRETEAMLLKIMEVSRSLNITAIIGAPLLHKNNLFDCAAVVQKGHITGIVPKSYPTVQERRWFASSKVLSENEEYIFCGQSIPFGAKLIFQTSNYKFGIEIGNDSQVPYSPAIDLCLAGAEIIFNPAANHEVVGEHLSLRRHIIELSSRHKCGFAYTSSGFGESTQDLVFTGKAFIAEDATMLAEGQRFLLDKQLIYSEIDIENLRHQRVRSEGFSTETIGSHCRYVNLEDDFRPNTTFVLTRHISPHPFITDEHQLEFYCEEALNIQSEGLIKRLQHTHASTAIVGISGGLDSTLALLVCINAFDRLKLERSAIIGVTMPGFGTTDRTYNNAINLMKHLGITIREIPIANAVKQHFSDISHNLDVHDVTYENSQARERTQILMDIANQMNGMVIGTGDLSELALGWATYNGDHMSMYGVNASVPKTMIRHIVRWVAQHSKEETTAAILLDILDTPISPELTPADTNGNIKQKTEDLVGPYELHDFFLYHFLKNGFSPSKIYFLACHAFAQRSTFTDVYDNDTIKKWLTTFCRRFFNQQFKRSCLPDGPMVTTCSLSPRGEWIMPSDACSTSWLNDIASDTTN